MNYVSTFGVFILGTIKP